MGDNKVVGSLQRGAPTAIRERRIAPLPDAGRPTHEPGHDDDRHRDDDDVHGHDRTPAGAGSFGFKNGYGYQYGSPLPGIDDERRAQAACKRPTASGKITIPDGPPGQGTSQRPQEQIGEQERSARPGAGSRSTTARLPLGSSCDAAQQRVVDDAGDHHVGRDAASRNRQPARLAVRPPPVLRIPMAPIAKRHRSARYWTGW